MAAARRKTKTSLKTTKRKPPSSGVDAGDLLRFLVLMGISLLVLMGGIGLRGVWESSEAENAEIARRMVVTGDWAGPGWNLDRKVRPPLPYWFIAVSYKAFGVSETTARLPVSLAAAAVVALVFLMGKSKWRADAGFWSGLILLTSILFFTAARTASVQIWVCLGLTMSMHGFSRLLEGKPRGIYLFWPGVLIAYLSGGVYGLLAPVAGAVLNSVISRRLKPLAALAAWRGWVLFAAPAFVWLVWALWIRSDFVGPFFVAVSGRMGFGEPLTALALSFFPWVVLLPWAWQAGKPKPGTKKSDRTPVHFCALWSLACLVLSPLSTEPGLMMFIPALPGAALLAGGPLAGLLSGNRSPKNPTGSILTLGGIVTLAGISVLIWPFLSDRVEYEDLGLLLLLGPCLAVAVGVAAVRFKTQAKAAVILPLGVFVIFILCAGLSATVWERSQAPARLMEPLKHELKPGDVLVVFGPKSPDLSFYLRQNALFLAPAESNDEDLLTRLSSPRKRYVVISGVGDYARLEAKAKGRPGLLLFMWRQSGGRVLFSNRPR